MDSGNIVEIIAVTGGIAVVIFAIIAWTIVTLVRGRGPARPARETEDESRMLQEMYHGLSKMERRIETLETLLLEREREKRG